MMSALQHLPTQQFTRQGTILLSLQAVQIWDIPSSKTGCVPKVYFQIFIWDQKTFSHRNNFINGGAPQMPG